MINIVKPFLPKKKNFNLIINEIWSRNYLTNNGPVIRDYEVKLGNFLRTATPCVVSNGTVALQFAIRALKLKGEVITTPFSYVASTSSLVWEQCKPVFVDIDENTFNIDAKKIEERITSKTSGILVTHTFGNPCEIEQIDKIAKQYNLKVIYDASHCFGTMYKGKSIFNYGDISTLSLHATKLVHMVEGGAIFSNNDKHLKDTQFMRNFGHDGPEEYRGVGINGKNSEIHAAMGQAVLPYANDILKKRKEDYMYYVERLSGLNLTMQQLNPEGVSNFSYFPIKFEKEQDLLKTVKLFELNNIFAKRYFYPSLSKLHYLTPQILPIVESTSKRILCLPIFFDMKREEQDFICNTLCESLTNKMIPFKIDTKH